MSENEEQQFLYTTLSIRETTMEINKTINDTFQLNTQNDTFTVSTPSSTLPPELRFNNNALAAIIVYSGLFIVAAIGNLTVFVTLCRNRHRKSRINLMIMHLAIADMVVTFIMIPLEVGWRATTQWLAGNAACKVFVFLRAFGLYLSSMVLVCVSLDRYFAILHPLRVNDARRRGKVMLILAWVVSIVCSIPQSVVFHVSRHPIYKDYVQCVTFGFFSSQTEETAYNLFCVLVMYFIPLLVICFAYTRILWEISKKSKETKDDWSREGRYQGRMRLRRSDMSNIERARARTLRMTLIIVLVFIWCWTPYVVMTLWYMFDRESATLVDGRVQDALFIMAVSNSCMNPLVYGTYAMNFKQEFQRCIECACFRMNKASHCSNTVVAAADRAMQNCTSPAAAPVLVEEASADVTSYSKHGGISAVLGGCIPDAASSSPTAAVTTAARPGDSFSTLSAANFNNTTRSTCLNHHGADTTNAANFVSTGRMSRGKIGGGGAGAGGPEILPDFISYQVSGHSCASLSGEYSHGSIAFYSEPIQCPNNEPEIEETESCWWLHGSRVRQRGTGTTASARLHASPSMDRLDRLRRWQGTTEVHRTGPISPSPITIMCRFPRL